MAGAPAQESVTVTTTAGDGSGSAVFGVDLIINQNSKNWNGEEEIDYLVEVENTGQTNETVNLVVEEGTGPGCAPSSSFTVTLSETSVNVDQDDSETVTATVEVPEGATADKYCWEITGTVANDPAQEAKDTEGFDLEVPELRTCTLALNKASVSVNPDDETKITATYATDGNAAWTVDASAVGSTSSWVRGDGPSSGLLPYDNGNGERAFDFIVSPDDSVLLGPNPWFKSWAKTATTAPLNARPTCASSWANHGAPAFLWPTPCSPTSNPAVTNPPRSPSPTRVTDRTTFGWLLPSLPPDGPCNSTPPRYPSALATETRSQPPSV